MAMISAATVPLDERRLDAVVDVLGDAFQGYPVMTFVVGSDGDVESRVRRLVRLFTARRHARGGPMTGVFDGEVLAGATIITLPVEPPPPAIVAEITASAWRDLGADAAARYDQYVEASNFFGSLPPHHHLNMIGVLRSHKGRGLARPLIDAVIARAEADPASHGVSLTTENPRNVELYRHFGFEVMGERAVVPGLTTWGMFRAKR